MASGNTILIHNIYYMLSYAFQELRKNNYNSIVDKEDFENIMDLFAEILYRGISEQLKQGLHKEYVEEQETLSVLRGKLDINGTIRNTIQCKRKLDCEYDELSVNNIYNSILKSTILVLIYSNDVNSMRKKQLRSLIPFFIDISEIDLKEIRWNSFRFQRNNRNYRMLMNICYFIVDGVLMTTNLGCIHVPTFSEDHLNRLFEKFVLNYYKRHYPQLRANADSIKWNILTSEESVGLELLPSMRSDITLHSANHTLVIDTKYYSKMTQVQYGQNKIHSNNLYQIFAYVNNADKEHCGNVSGMLLYAQTTEDVIPKFDAVINGNRIIVQTLDLNQNFDAIKMQLNKIVIDVLGS